jgi:hypothetical protein
MEAGDVIIVLTVIEVLALVAIMVLGMTLAGTGKAAAGRVKLLVTPATKIRAHGFEGLRLARTKSDQIVKRGKALALDLTRKWQTARHLIEEVVHPGRPPIETVTEPLDRGRRLVGRLSRLQAAARKAAGSR